MKQHRTLFLPALRSAVFAGLCVIVPLMLACSPDLAAGTSGSETGNGKISGCVVDTAGNRLSNVLVMVLPDTYDPRKSGDPVLLDTTDNSGNYTVTCHKGTYTVLSVHLQERTRSYSDRVTVTVDETTPHIDTVKPPGSIAITLSERSDLNKGYFYIPGTTINSSADQNNGLILLDSVPAATISTICYSEIDNDEVRVIRNDVHVVADSSIVILHPEWIYRRPVYINTSSTGVRTAKEVNGFPLLLHLSENSFPFEQARNDGTDLLFTNSEGARLPCEIEQWNKDDHLAFIWVKVDTVRAHSDSQHIMMWWGNPSAYAIEDRAVVFDTADGFQGVWHLGENNTKDSHVVTDLTPNGNDGVLTGNRISTVAGLIGSALSFEGTAGVDESYVKLPAAETLDFNGKITISCWVRLDENSPDSFYITGKISSCEEQPNFCSTTGYALFCSSRRTVQLRVGVGSGQFIYVENDYGIDDMQWHYIVGMFESGKLQLSVDTTFFFWDLPEKPVGSQEEGFIGGKILHDGTRPFAGEIDEVRICNVVRSADWIKLNYYNRKFNDLLLTGN